MSELGETLRTPIFVFSDLHLGHPASYVNEVESMLPLLEGAATVVFNGDTFEYLSLRRRASAVEYADRLFECCNSVGARPILVTGNHDPHASSAHHLDLLEGRVFITHGDVLHPALAPWSKEAGFLLQERERLSEQHPDDEDLLDQLVLTKRCAMVASLYDNYRKRGLIARLAMPGKFLAEPWRIYKAFSYWASVPTLARSLQRRFRPEAKLMLVGHSHRAGVWRKDDFTLVNTGSYQPLSQPLVVRIEADHAIVTPAQRRGASYRYGRPMAPIPLDFPVGPTELECVSAGGKGV